MLTIEEKAQVEDLFDNLTQELEQKRFDDYCAGRNKEKRTPTIQATQGNLSYHCPKCDDELELLAGSIGECPQCQTQL